MEFGSLQRAQVSIRMLHNHIDNMSGDRKGCCSRGRGDIGNMHDALGINEVKIINKIALQIQTLALVRRIRLAPSRLKLTPG